MARQEVTLGSEIRRLRSLSGSTLRGFAKRIGVSAPHLSDIEHDRRRPSKELLKKIAHELRSVGATYEALDKLDPRPEKDVREWAAETPEARTMLRMARDATESGRPMADVLKKLERALKQRRGRGD
ncbi:MAG TPA: helix-turn-helix transcriptional regulator [Candidatus Eisenbacteria bacterium]|jgi:transcriptional regulator with XRE-family HTH domain